MKDYETIFILAPNMSEEEVEKVSQRMQEVVAGSGGEIMKVEKWGKKKLAYPVKKHKKGEYVFFQYQGGSAAVSELERNFKMTDSVIKFMTIKVDKDMLAPPVPEPPVPVEGAEGVAAEAAQTGETVPDAAQETAAEPEAAEAKE